MTDSRAREIAKVQRWIEQALEPLNRQTEELSERIENLKREMNVVDTVELAEAKAMRYIKEHGVTAETALNWVTAELSQKETASRIREHGRQQEKAEALEEMVDEKASGLSYQETIELVERVDQGEVL